MLSKIEAEVLDLKVLQYNADYVLSRELELGGPYGIEFVMRELPERLAGQIAMMLRVPGQVLQENRLIHQHPATLWDHIKQRVAARIPALKRYLPIRYVEIRLTEHLVYPTVRVPAPYADSVRLYAFPDFDTSIL